MLRKVTHCAGHVLANTRPHQLCWDDWEIDSASLYYRLFQVGVASRLATAIYVAMVTPIFYDNSYSLNDSNLKYESYRPYG